MFCSAIKHRKKAVRSQLPTGILYAHSILTQRVAASLFHLCAKLLTNRKYEMCLRRKVYMMKILFALFQR